MSNEPRTEQDEEQSPEPIDLPETPLHLLASLPPWLRKLVDKHYADICRGATLGRRAETSRHRRPTWRLRFRTFDERFGCHIRKTIGIGDDPTLVLVVQSIVEHLRAARCLRLEQERSAKAAKERKAREVTLRRKELRKLAQATVGGSPRVRQKVGRDVDALYDDPRAMLAYSVLFPGAYQPQVRKGRPRGRGLWPMPRESVVTRIKKIAENAASFGAGAQSVGSAASEASGA